MEVTKEDLETIVHGTATAEQVADGTPEALRYVRIEPRRLVACDARILIVREISDETEEQFEPFCVSVPDIRAALKANAELWKPNGQTVTLDPGTEFMAHIGRKAVVKQDVEYIDWQKALVKKNKPGQKMAAFNPGLLVKACKGLRDVGKAEFRIWDEKSASRFDAVTGDGRKIMALVMPIVPR